MSARHTMLALAVAVAPGAPTAAGAQDISFTYVDGGMIWTATPAFHLQGHVRYTSVGEVVTEGSDTFDSDTLIGLNGRWYFRPDIAFITGYEFGKITTWNLGVRFTF